MSMIPDRHQLRQQTLGQDLVGREILVCWDDGVWYDAVVVQYYYDDEEYKIVYRADDGIEVTKLCNRRWILVPKKKDCTNQPILDGATIEFLYPPDGNRYKAMIYAYSNCGERLKIAYIDEHSTDNLKGGGWEFVSPSPCLDNSDEDDAYDPEVEHHPQKLHEKLGKTKSARTKTTRTKTTRTRIQRCGPTRDRVSKVSKRPSRG